MEGTVSRNTLPEYDYSRPCRRFIRTYSESRYEFGCAGFVMIVVEEVAV